MGAERTICCVAEIESTASTACPNCLGTELQTTVQSGPFGKSWTADAFFAGGSLESYRFDDAPTQDIPAEYPSEKIEIPYPPGGFTHLCIKYNREGGARINVVAVNLETKARICPAATPANGQDPLCPIASALMDGQPLDPAVFQWSDEAVTDALAPDQKGGWTTEPPSAPGDLTLKARGKLSEKGQGDLVFVGWEHNRLSNWLVGTEHQWIGEGDTYTLDKNTFAGLIAYYKPQKLIVHEPDVPDYKPGPITYGYPEPLRRLFDYLRGIAEAVFNPRRRVTAHDIERLSRTLPAAEQARLRTLAKADMAARHDLDAFVAKVERR